MMGGFISDQTIEISVTEYDRFIRNTDRLNTILTAILDCTQIDRYAAGNTLEMRNSSDLLALIRFLYPDEYECRFEILQEAETKKEEADE